MTSWLSGERLLSVVLFGCAMSALTWRTHAEVVPDLYAVSVPVAEQSQSELQRAAATGLRELAVRISGRGSASSEPALSPAFANAMHYLEQYRYERNSGGDSPWLAQLRFAPAQIDAELRKGGLPVWGGNRPALLTVVAVEDKGVRTIIDEQSPLANTLREQWRRRGLLLHLPGNASAVNADDVMRLDSAKIIAGLPERSDGLVLGHAVLTAAGNCDTRWSLNLGAQVFNAEATGNALPVCVANAFDRIADNFSTQYAIAANSSSEGIVLRVTGVVSFDDYSALLNYLRRLTVIKSAQPVLMRADEILFQLKIAGSADQLARQFALESRLTPAENTANTSPGIDARLPAALSYRWAMARN